jgi:regulator of sigma E protease
VSNFSLYTVAFLGLLCVLIFFHELGHYLAARYCDVKVLRFSIGFGRVIWQRRFGRDQTEWALSIFPLGGYVKMLDEREGDVAAEDAARAFNRQSVGKRSIIVAAGPLANFALAVVLYWIVFMLGSEELMPVLGKPAVNSPAEIAQIHNGELVRSVDGRPVETWNDFRWLVLQKAVDQESLELEVINEQNEISFRRLRLAAAGENGWEGDAFERLGLVFYRPSIPAVLGSVAKGGVADLAGLQAGDRVLSVDHHQIVFWHDFVLRVRESAGKGLSLVVERQGQNATVHIVPEAISERGQTVGKIGVAVGESGQNIRQVRTFVRYGVLESAGKSVVETWDKSVFSLQMMGKMLTGEVSWKNLSGPVTIADYAGKTAKLGLDYYLKFMAMVSISLGILNLLPIPVLDGGHLMYHIIEVVRRRPLSERAMEISQQIGVSLLVVLMAFAFFNDLNRLFFG